MDGPSEGWMKRNVDGSYSADGLAGADTIQISRVFLLLPTQLFSCRDALEAELCAAMEELYLAL